LASLLQLPADLFCGGLSAIEFGLYFQLDEKVAQITINKAPGSAEGYLLATAVLDEEQP
jgi:hypothetical protein